MHRPRPVPGPAARSDVQPCASWNLRYGLAGGELRLGSGGTRFIVGVDAGSVRIPYTFIWRTYQDRVLIGQGREERVGSVGIGGVHFGLEIHPNLRR